MMGLEGDDFQRSLDYIAQRIPRLQSQVRRLRWTAILVWAAAPLLFALELLSGGAALTVVLVAYFGQSASTSVCHLHIDALLHRKRDLLWRNEWEPEVADHLRETRSRWRNDDKRMSGDHMPGLYG